MHHSAMIRKSRRPFQMVVLLGFTLAISGCGSIPIVTSRVDPEPFKEPDLEFLEPGSTELQTVTDRFGPAQIVRRQGRLHVFAVSVNQSRVVLVGGGSPFRHHYLFIEVDDRGVVQRYVLLRPDDELCTSWGVCIQREPWQYSQGFFSLGHDELSDSDIAVLLEARETDTLAKEHVPGAGECAIYLYSAYRSGTSSMIRIAAGEDPWRYVPEGTYAWITPPPGRQTIRASYGADPEAVDDLVLELDCEPGRAHFVELSGWNRAKLRMAQQPEATAKERLTKRRLILL